jgi:hypothetical protein
MARQAAPPSPQPDLDTQENHHSRDARPTRGTPQRRTRTRKFLNKLKARLALRMSSKDTDSDTDAAIKNIDGQLADGQRFRRIARAIKPTTKGALTKVDITTECTHLHPKTSKVVTLKTIKTVDTRKALETAIIERNKRHFAQAQGTPFTCEPFSRIGRSNGYDVYTDKDGHEIQVPEDSFIETKTVLQLLRERQCEPGPRWSEEVSFDEFISCFLHWREQTSTSPSGRHLGLYGTLVAAYCNSGGEFSTYHKSEDLTTQEMSEQILMMIHGLAASAARLGFFLHRWIHVINVMIYKKPGCMELDKLRVINLFEADFNLMIGTLFGRRAMHHQVNKKLMNPARFGRPGGECADATIAKVLHNLTAKLSHTPMGQFESDTTACFDHEIMTFVLTCYKSTGAPLGP